MRDPLRWFTFPSDGHGKPPTVWLAHDWNYKELVGHFAVTHPDIGEIWVNAGENEATQDYYLFHECVHHGIWKTPWLPDRREERVAVRLTKKLWPPFRALGLHWPRRPAGYAALRREALQMTRSAATKERQ